MAKTITLFLTTGPYAGENTHTTIRRGIANPEEEFSRLIGKGLAVFL